MKKAIACSICLVATSLFSEPEEIIIRLAKDADGQLRQISEEEYQKTERRDFSFTLLPTDEALKRVGDAFGKRIIVYHPFENSKNSVNVRELSFDDMMKVLLEPMGYEYKEFDGGIVVVVLSRSDRDQ